MVSNRISLRNDTVFVGRHKALYQYCLEKGYIDSNTPAFFGRVRVRDIKGKDVIGVLSLSMASFAKTFTEIPLYGCRVQPGLELDIEDIREGAMPPVKYQIRKVA